MSSEVPLEGVRLYRPDIQASPPPHLQGKAREGLRNAYLGENDYLATYAKELGALVTPMVIGESFQGFEPQPNEYILLPNRQIVRNRTAVESVFFSSAEGIDIPRVNKVPYEPDFVDTWAARLEQGEPLVLAYEMAHIGHAKYLLERPDQLRRFERFCAAFSALEVCQGWTIREFVETPSNRYTSYRIMMSASGEYFGGLLNYSRIIKNQGEVVCNDRLDECGGVLRIIKQQLENPNSFHYLGARDIRCIPRQDAIPLLGERLVRPLTNEEESLLEAHDVDPGRPCVPPAMLANAQAIVRYCGPRLGILQGLDFVQDKYLEINSDPGASTYIKCGFKGDLVQAYRAMYQRALHSLARR